MEELRKIMKVMAFKYTSSMDIKDKYFERADEIAFKRHGVGFYDLSEKQQDKIWREAEVLVHEELQENADNMRQEFEMQGIDWRKLPIRGDT